MEVRKSSFTDWNRCILMINSFIEITLNIHPISNIGFLDLNSLVIDGEHVGEKYADILLAYGISADVKNMINNIYGINIETGIPLRKYLSNPPKITSPYFDSSKYSDISFDKSLGGRILFLYNYSMYKDLPKFISIIRRNVNYYGI